MCALRSVGIEQVARALAIEWGGSAVRVNAIAPGPIEGAEGMKRLVPTPSAQQAWTNCVPLKRFGTPRDIQRAALWLCSDKASYVTGVILPVDGGTAPGGAFDER